MRKLKSKSGRISKKVTFKLKMVDGTILLITPKADYQLNEKKLRLDGAPREIINYLINVRPGEVINKDEIKNAAKIFPPQDFRQVLYKAGFDDTIRGMFVSHFSKESVAILNEVTYEKVAAEFYMEHFEDLAKL